MRPHRNGKACTTHAGRGYPCDIALRVQMPRQVVLRFEGVSCCRAALLLVVIVLPYNRIRSKLMHPALR